MPGKKKLAMGYTDQREMLDFESLMSGAPVPTVGAGDVRRVWEFISEATPRIGVPPGTVGFNIALIAQQCGKGADPLAVFFRAAFLDPLVQSGLLDSWRDGDRPHDVVFQAIATFPLPDGIQSFRPEEFAEALRKTL